ncbi:FAD-binding protein [Brevirhabdus sp.]|uniref:FAD-binding protein n=1 Tax=Brevirhabdus sp. TaxID=2004514 RepID=UPI0040595FED
MLEPQSEAELAEIIADAGAPLAIRGGGTRLAVQGPGQVLSVAGLAGVELYEPGALTIVVGAGTPLEEVQAVLAQENQRLPFEPPDLRAVLGTAGASTIGGVVAANASGPRRIQAGACRDSLIGVRFVDGRGEVIKNGGRVMKNVTGYDLVKLMAGSHGTLGVLSQLSFKVLPGVEAAGMLLLPGLDPRAAVVAMSRALGSPFEVSGAAHVPGSDEGRGALTALRVEGFKASVGYRLDRLRALLRDLAAGEVVTDAAEVADHWRGLRDLDAFVGGQGDLWRVSVTPSDGPGVLARLAPQRALMDWGGGLVWAECAPGMDARAALAGLRGHATLVRAADPATAAARFHPEPAPLAAIARGLRAQFDPKGILNPGLMG